MKDLVLILLLAPLLAGCLYSREIAHVRRDIERQYPDAVFDREVVVSLGPVALRTARWIAGRVPEAEAELAHAYLQDVRRVKVGVYRADFLPPLEAVDLPARRRFERDGWEVAVATREDDEAAWVLYRERDGAIRDLYVLVLSEEELVVARLRGRLDRLMARALEDHADLDALVEWD